MNSNYYRAALVGCLALLWVAFVGGILGGLVA
jgi:hypothetical protein